MSDQELKVFISYSTKDSETALGIMESIERAGTKCWMAPRDIPSGAAYAESIIDGIESSAVMLVVFSSHSNDSIQVHREVDRAVNAGAVILTVRIEDLVPSKAMDYYLCNTQWFDYFEKNEKALISEIDVILEKLREGTFETNYQLRKRSQTKRSLTWVYVACFVLVACLGVYSFQLFSPPYLNKPIQMSDLEDKTPWEIALMKKAIVAPYGYIMKDPKKRKHFMQFIWYRPAGELKDADRINNNIVKNLTKVEKDNYKILASHFREVKKTKKEKRNLYKTEFIQIDHEAGDTYIELMAKALNKKLNYLSKPKSPYASLGKSFTGKDATLMIELVKEEKSDLIKVWWDANENKSLEAAMKMAFEKASTDLVEKGVYLNWDGNSMVAKRDVASSVSKFDHGEEVPKIKISIPEVLLEEKMGKFSNISNILHKAVHSVIKGKNSED